MSQFVIIRNSRTGAEKRVSAKTWELMPKSQKKEYSVVGKVLDKSKPDPAARMRSENSFIPAEIQEAVREKEHEAKVKAESVMISGEALNDAPASSEATATKDVSAPAETQEAPKGDNLTVISGLTAKTAEVLQTIGITTFAQLASAPKAKLAEALNSANLQAKAEQVPNWQAKAAEISK